MMGTPLMITLYGSGAEENEAKRTYSRTVIPWGILKKAIHLTKTINPEHIGIEDVDAIAGLVVDAFGNQFTLSDLDKGADIREMMTVVESIVARASSMMNTNPTNLPTARKRSK